MYVCVCVVKIIKTTRHYENSAWNMEKSEKNHSNCCGTQFTCGIRHFGDEMSAVAGWKQADSRPCGMAFVRDTNTLASKGKEMKTEKSDSALTWDDDFVSPPCLWSPLRRKRHSSCILWTCHHYSQFTLNPLDALAGLFCGSFNFFLPPSPLACLFTLPKHNAWSGHFSLLQLSQMHRHFSQFVAPSVDSWTLFWNFFTNFANFFSE